MAIAQVSAKFTADTSQLTAALATVRKNVTSSAQRVTEAGTTMGTALGAAGGAMAIGLGLAVKKAADFEQQMDRVGAISGATGEEMKALRKTALDLGASTSLSAMEVSQGMEQMAASGFEVNEIIAAMPGVIAAAEASGEDLAVVSEVVAAALNGFGLEAEQASRVADVMAMSANQSAASVDDLGYAFKYAAPVAKQLGFSIEWLAAATGVMVDAGLEGSQAGTTLRMALSRLVKPPKEAANAIEGMGISMTDSTGKMRPVTELLPEVMDGLRGMSKEQRTAAAQTIFGTEAMSGMLALMDKSPEEFDKLVKGLENAGGEAQRTAAKMKDNLKGSLEELGGAFETLQISIGGALAPAIRVLADALALLVNWFNGIPGPVQSFLAISAAVVSILLLVGSAIAFVVAGLGAVAAALGVTIGTVAAFIGIAAGIVAAVMAIGAIFVLAYNKVDWFRNMVNQAWTSIKEGFDQVVAFLMPAVQAVVDFVVNQWNKIKEWWDTSGPTIIQACQNIFDFIKSIIGVAMDVIMAIFNFVWPFIETLIVSTWENIKGVISGAIGVVLSAIDIFANLLTGNWSGLWDSILNYLKNAWQLIWNLFMLWGVGKVVGLAIKLGSKLLSVFGNAWSGISKSTSNFLSNIWSWIKGKFTTISNFTTSIMNKIKAVKDRAWSAISNKVNSVVDKIKSVVQGRFDSIKSKISSAMVSVKSHIANGFNKAKSVVDSVATKIQSKLSGMASKAKTWGRNLLDMFASGIKSKVSAVISSVKGVANKVKDYLGFSSPTKKGPMSKSDKFGPNFTNMLAKTMLKPLPRVQRAVSAIAGEMDVLDNQSMGSYSIDRTRVSQPSVNRSGFVPSDRYAFQGSSGGGVTVTGNTFYVRKDSDIKSIAREIDRLTIQRMRAKGKVRW